MPRKGAATAAPPAPPEEPDNQPETQPGGRDEVQDPPAEEKPKRGGRRRGGQAEDPPPPDDKAIEDWTRPSYADDPGEFLFDEMDDTDEWYRVMFFGVEGTGKTTDVAMVTRITEGRILMINAEAGAKKSALSRHGVDTSRIALYPPKGQQLTFEGLERLFYRIQADLEADPNSWAAVVWDSITAIYQKLLDDVIEADIRKTAEILQRANKGRGGRAGNLTMRGRFETDRDDYAEMSNQVRLLLRKYRSLHCHLLITALERRDEDKKKNVTIGPAVSPALATDLLGYMDAVIRTQVNEHGVYFGRTQPTDEARGKDRLNALPVELVDPTIERIDAYVNGDLTEDIDRAQRRLPDREVITRRSLADEYLDEDATTGTYGPTDEERTDPPKRSGGRRAASSGRSTASAKPSATGEPADSEPESGATEPEEAAAEEKPDPPKRGGRRARGSTSAAAAEPTAPAEEKPARRSGRKPPAERAARATVKAETEGKEKGPATRAAGRRAATNKAEAAMKSEGYDKPPF